MRLQQQDSQEDKTWWKTDTQAATFRLSPLWLVALFLGEIALLFVFQQLYSGHPIPPQRFFALVAFVVCISSLFMLAFPLRTGQSGLQGQSAFGSPVRLRWEEMERVSRFNFLGLRFLRITSKHGGWAMYCPLFLTDPQRFWEQVFRFTSEENPLRRFATRDRA